MAIRLHVGPLIPCPCHGQSLGAHVPSRNAEQMVECVGQSSGPGTAAARWTGSSRSHRSLRLTSAHFSEHEAVRFTVRMIVKRKWWVRAPWKVACSLPRGAALVLREAWASTPVEIAWFSDRVLISLSRPNTRDPGPGGGHASPGNPENQLLNSEFCGPVKCSSHYLRTEAY